MVEYSCHRSVFVVSKMLLLAIHLSFKSFSLKLEARELQIANYCWFLLFEYPQRVVSCMSTGQKWLDNCRSLHSDFLHLYY